MLTAMAKAEITFEQPSRQARAAETKKHRTREKLIHAADDALRDKGWSATVEDICDKAGISSATFYSYYTSRYVLCLDAVLELIVLPLENRGVRALPFDQSRDAFLKQCAGRKDLVRAALIGRLEAPGLDALLSRVTGLLRNKGAIDALYLLDQVAMQQPVTPRTGKSLTGHITARG